MNAVTIKRRVRAETVPGSDTNQLNDMLHEQSWISQLLYNRGVSSDDELAFSLAGLPRPDSLHDIESATLRLAQAVQQQQSIVVIGDYDCDGATSTALAVLALRAMGAQSVHYCLPNRFIHGYGLSPAVVDEAFAFSPDLIITVDNGITSLDGVAYAGAQGVDVVVTDHHLPGSDLPAAVALVNPRLGNHAGGPSKDGGGFPSMNLAGVGVIFFVVAALRRHLEQQGWFETQDLAVPNMAGFLDLVAVGTVADVVPLDRVNRILVMQGMRRIRAGHCRPGLLALLELSASSLESVFTDTIGFRIAPRLNAAGRLDDMRHGVECLLAEDSHRASELAMLLDNHNQQRRSISETMQDSAIAALHKAGFERKPIHQQQLSICLYDPEWHEGTIGILAGRLKELHGRPTIAFTAEQSNESPKLIKGSARSIDGYHIVDAFQRISLIEPALLQRFGGHAKAAGLTIAETEFEKFSELLEADVRDHFDGSLPGYEIISDGFLPLDAFSIDNAELLESLAPWGQEFPVPVFDNLFEVIDYRLLREKHLKLVLHPQSEEGESSQAQTVEAICFNFVGNARAGDIRRASDIRSREPSSRSGANDKLFAVGDRLRILFELKTNTFRNQTSLQLNCRYLEKVG